MLECVCERAGASVVWITGYARAGRPRTGGVTTLGTAALAGVNQGGSVQGTKSSSLHFLESACVMACRDLDMWDCGWQSVSGCDWGSFN